MSVEITLLSFHAYNLQVQVVLDEYDTIGESCESVWYSINSPGNIFTSIEKTISLGGSNVLFGEVQAQFRNELALALVRSEMHFSVKDMPNDGRRLRNRDRIAIHDTIVNKVIIVPMFTC